MKYSLRLLLSCVTVFCLICGAGAAFGVFGFAVAISALCLVGCCVETYDDEDISISGIASQCSLISVVALLIQAILLALDQPAPWSSDYTKVVFVLFGLAAPVMFFVTAIGVQISHQLFCFVISKCNPSAKGLVPSRETPQGWQVLPRHFLASTIVWTLCSVSSNWSSVPSYVTEWTFSAIGLAIALSFLRRAVRLASAPYRTATVTTLHEGNS